MNILAFDTCFGACSVAVGRDMGDGRARIEAVFERRQTGHAEALMPMMRRAMAGAGLGFAELDRIAVTAGPGTFTGTRIGIAAARALTLSTGAPIIGASSLAVMAWAAGAETRKSEREDLMIAVDARRGEVYVQLFANGGRDERSAPLLLTIAEAARLGGSGPVVVAGSGAGAVAAAAAAGGRAATARRPGLEPEASALVWMAIGLEPQPAPLRPIYLRPPDAKPQTGTSLARVS
ncbi:MAG TPA: tRNA (adenosine(37)-N6)-threonylcarbamoyltransferase complex dimerization subunit type 1 TsaB [Hyphomicrobiaceae bacterium]|nr:tRNA (adenosine(37)-N6)-threonylcarbamoyltransferase complex dimerization subunit type 1 TsaB [Hyphomicrobiaceae bacterium]